jgi:predicted amidohydrolase YtcJ
LSQVGQGIRYRCKTLNVAWSLLIDEETGTIEAGKWADMIILNHNLFEIPKTDIHKTEVEKTIFKGKLVYQKDQV